MNPTQIQVTCEVCGKVEFVDPPPGPARPGHHWIWTCDECEANREAFLVSLEQRA